ncbi:hypothetical protein NRP93_003584 [Clostridium botulinum]|nr:hypothetical protein [Clostridium botulinum]
MATFISTFRNQKIQLTDEEINRFNLIENENIRKSCMSIYTSLLIQNSNLNNKLKNLKLSKLKEDNYKYSISLKKLREKYNKNHDSISIRTLLNRINKLKELGLLIVEKIKKTNVYSFFRYLDVNKKVNEKLHDKKDSVSTVTTKFKCNVKILNCKIFNFKDLDSNSNMTITIDNFDYEKYLEENKKCTLDYAFLLTKKAFKLLRVRSNKIKSFVIDKVTRYYKNITKKHAMKYICNIITSAREGYYKNYKSFNKEEKIDRFNDFEQRNYTKEDFKRLEDKLFL